MRIHYCSGYEEMSRLAYETIVSGLQKNPDQLMCAATGNSPIGVYEKLERAYEDDPDLFVRLRIIKLDEWGGTSPKELSSCETFIHQKILSPLHISKDRYISFKSNPVSPEKECGRMRDQMLKKGPIDLCVLGLGKNGHIGFNEPADALTPHCHIARLSKESLQHQMTKTMGDKPTYGLTLGMADILRSKKIILLVTGSNKKNVIEKLLSKRIDTYLPASFLWLHNDVDCYMDMQAM